MSGQRSRVAPKSSRGEAVEEYESDLEPDTIEDGKQLWKDIQAQTGFSSYKDYVRAHIDRGGAREDLDVLWQLIAFQNDYEPGEWCTIVDVTSHEDSPPELFIRYYGTEPYRLLAALRQPRKHVCVQVIVWPVKTRVSARLTDILGLGLRMDPQFFLAVLCQWGELVRFGNAVDTRPLRPSHVVIDHVAATFVRHYPIDEPIAPPIILIAGDLDFTQGFECVASQNISSPPPFTLPKAPIQSGRKYGSDLRWLDIYKETFSGLAENNHGITKSTVAIIAGVLMPLLHMNCLKIRTCFLYLRRTFLALQAIMYSNEVDREAVDHETSILRHERFILRRAVEDSDDGISHFERYISAEDVNYLPENAAWLKVKQETGQINDEARRLDAEIREYLQLVVGDLSLEESRKSIELSNNQIILSNNQISEAKRGL